MKHIIKFILVTILISSCSGRKDDPGVEYAPNMYHSVPYEPLSQVKDEEIGSWLDSNPSSCLINSPRSLILWCFIFKSTDKIYFIIFSNLNCFIC